MLISVRVNDNPQSPSQEPGNSNTGKPVCFNHQRGQCTSGARCRYSHDAPTWTGTPSSSQRGSSGPSRGRDDTTQNRPERDPIEYQLNDLIRMLSSRGELGCGQQEHLLSLGIKILDTDLSAVKQKLIKELAEEGGLRRIKHFVEARYVENGDLGTMTFEHHCIPFLKIITHGELRSSLVLEKSVGTIYNIIYGHSGERAIPFFRHVVDHLLRIAAGQQPPEFGNAVCSTVSAILMTLNINQSASVQEEFVGIVQDLRKCLHGGSEYVVRGADPELRRVEQKLHMAEAIPFSQTPQKPKAGTGFTFEVDVDMPGEFSVHGPRHDNDKASITEIRILPTPAEILSTMRNEYLPARNYSVKAHHLPPGIERVLDTQFRLLREDTSGQLRDAVRYLLDAREKNPNKDVNQPNGTQTTIHKNVIIECLQPDERDGLQLQVTFDQPQRLVGVKPEPDLMARTAWWNSKRSLQTGALLCLVDQQNGFTFLIVAQREVEEFTDRHHQDPEFAKEREATVCNLSSHPLRALVMLKLVDAANDVKTIVREYHRQLKFKSQNNYVLPFLVEFPGLLFASFEPILRFLQKMSDGSIPFSKLIAPEGNGPNDHPEANETGDAVIKVSPPLYLMRGSVILDLSVILKEPSANTRLTHSIERPCSILDLYTHTTLDKGQCEALLGGLSRELALIQGPPGTGKSYVGLQIVKVLLHNKHKIKMGPIVCVCYTNHALDQFLVELLNNGVEKLVRLGSRSQAEELKELTLRNVAAKVDTTFVERSSSRNLKADLTGLQGRIGDLCLQISRINHWTVMRDHLQEKYPEIESQLFGRKTLPGWQTVTHRKQADAIHDWLNLRLLPKQGGGARPDLTVNQLLDCQDISTLHKADRARLKGIWEEEIRQELLHQLKRLITEFKVKKEELDMTMHERDRRCLQEAEIIGVTTTGLAGHASLLRKLEAKVMICEEAGEVLESHTLTALLPSVEHAILIGDHQQLRPQIANYNLSMESRQGVNYALDESLFERLTREKYGPDKLSFPFATLDTQRRMHPSISELVRRTLYPDLQDHEKTKTHSEVDGMARRLFWLNHNQLEAGADQSDPSGVSKSNDFEIEMVGALVKHLIKQGSYEKNDIAVLTPYLGQLMKLRQKMGSMFEILVGEKDQEELDLVENAEEVKTEIMKAPKQDVRKGKLLSEIRLATVDNFQGEEAKVIVISLVRCNPAHRCGFLKTSNRINVLLSRARNGMYIIGNADTARPVSMWSNVLTLLNREGNFGDALGLRCPRHVDKQIFVSTPDDFLRFSPEGGCDERCGKRLISCGHTCIHKCHSDMLHKAVVCLEECKRKLPGCDHACPTFCGEECQRCVFRIPQVLLPCGHTSYGVPCHQAQNPTAIRCSRSVKKRIPGCGHLRDVACHLDVSSPTFQCVTICEKNLPCGHQCKGKCHECRNVPAAEGQHVKCKSPCGRGFNTCGHSCPKECHGEEACGLCEQMCELRCSHSQCTKKCSEACTPCAEQCTWNCVHRGTCNMPCAVPCDVLPCSKRCELVLECGHQCPSVCGERCPKRDLCQVPECGTPEHLDTVVDFVCMETYKEIDLETNPIIILSCGHFFCMDTVDGLMQMSDVYEYNKDGNLVGQKPQSAWIEAIQQSQTRCPSCRRHISNINRYNRVTKGVMIAALNKKFLAMAHESFLSLEKEVSEAERVLHESRNTLEASFQSFLTETSKGGKSQKSITSFHQGRHAWLNLLARKALSFVESTAKEEQPYGRIHTLVADGIRRKRVTDASYTADDISFSPRYGLEGEVLVLRVHWARLYDLLQILELASVVNRPADAKALLKNIIQPLEDLKVKCKRLEENAEEALYPRQQVEAILFHARFVGLELNHPDPTPPPAEPVNETRIRERNSLDEALKICRQKPGSTRGLEALVEAAQKMMRESVFYSPVTTDEQRAVYEAMRSELRGTGHWYYCVNRHPFTVGECGMPMREARCPQCDAPIGGQNHIPVAGVSRATDLEEQFGRMRM
ncbi:hypothetical protein L211DRAFT_787516 [Terfezia boudieri ATCC MYA-4762]|uniref:Uncharacterized protein n=1 Tax=Terfezia boudieri ATCC MYA-4762 TaxID=1051890 RepID=A0A3N4LJU7_9PEZI|nr:hypothetical protein L211DRAFT_787516 [Terfezia boudieri ATCC MYA-4762]